MMTDEAEHLIEQSFAIRKERMDVQRDFAKTVAEAQGPQIAALHPGG